MVSSQVPQAYSVTAFCVAHDLSRAHFYNLKKQGLAPATMRVGRRVLISAESAQKWRERLTAESVNSLQAA